MRIITYTPLPTIGPEDLHDETVPLSEFVKAIPYFLCFDLIPPFSVMNEEFRSGEHDAGMSGGCRWQPFEISQQEYEELASVLTGAGLKRTSPPDWVKTRDDWLVWTREYEMGVPSERLLPLYRETSKWTFLAEKALWDGEKKKWEELIIKASEASRKEQDFLDPYVDAYHKRRRIGKYR